LEAYPVIKAVFPERLGIWLKGEEKLREGIEE
jgi:hypothetical protein